MDRLTKEVKEYAKKCGADLIGIAPVERFKNAPLRMSPKGLLPSAKSVIVVAVHHLDASVELGGEPSPHDGGPYWGQSSAMNPKLDDIAFLLARFLEEKGYKTLPIPVTNIWRYKGYKDLKVDFAPDLVHRYAAVAAGLGEIGWSGLFLSPQFGPRQRLTSIITEAELTPDPMYSGKSLCDKCMECVKHCPTDAFRKEVKKINKIEIGGKVFKFPDTNKWRCAWAENFALSLDLKIPEKVDEKVILDTQEKYGQRGGEEGSCLKYCMVPDRRYYDKKYTSAPHRRKEKLNISAKKIANKIKEMAKESFVELLAIGNKKDFKDNPFVHPEFHLPDAESIICLGIEVSANEENPDFKGAVLRRLNYIEFEIAHYLDITGYSAVTKTKIADDLVAQQLGIYQSNLYFTSVLTNAKLPKLKRDTKIKKKTKIEKEDLKRFSRERGADLVGFFSQKRFEEFKNSVLKTRLLSQKENFYIEDKGAGYGSYIPEVKPINPELRTPQDYLSGAKSVIVLGLHFPDACLDTAKITPAETVGPYAFAHYETLFLLRDKAINIVKYIQQRGYQATISYDLCGMASLVKSSRGMLPDSRANRFAAILSGLGYIGDNGIPLTEKYGSRQRFISIITDYPFSDDPLYDGEIICQKCSHLCIKACPTKAIREKKISFSIEGKQFTFPEIDTKRCDWAKRYGLVGKGGPAYYGLKTDSPLPRGRITPEKIAAALSKIKWGVQKRHINICEECIRLCPAHKNSKPSI